MTGSRDVFRAIRAGDDQGLRLLLQEEPGLAVSCEGGVSALMMALYRRRQDMAEIILSKQPPLDIFEASAMGEREIAMELLREDESLLHAFAVDGYTALHLAAYFGRAPVVQRLIDRGADLRAVARNSMQVEPLHSAVTGRNLEIVRILLRAGADPRACQADGWTPLHAAAQNGDTRIARVLVEHGADIRATNDEGLTPIDVAKAAGHDSVL